MSCAPGAKCVVYDLVVLSAKIAARVGATEDVLTSITTVVLFINCWYLCAQQMHGRRCRSDLYIFSFLVMFYSYHIDVQLSHLNKDYLLTYLLTYYLTRLTRTMLSDGLFGI